MAKLDTTVIWRIHAGVYSGSVKGIVEEKGGNRLVCNKGTKPRIGVEQSEGMQHSCHWDLRRSPWVWVHCRWKVEWYCFAKNRIRVPMQCKETYEPVLCERMRISCGTKGVECWMCVIESSEPSTIWCCGVDILIRDLCVSGILAAKYLLERVQRTKCCLGQR